MKVAVIAPPWIEIPPKNYGGIEAVVALLVEHLIALGHDVTLFCSPGSRSKATIINPLGRSYEDQINKSLLETDYVLQALEIIKETGDFDVIHDHTTMAVALAKYCQIPMVHTMHNGHADERGAYYARHGGHASLIAISQAQKNTAPKSIKVSGVVSNPIDVTEWHFKANKRPYALWVGNFNSGKGAHFAIEAAKIAEIPLLMAGPIQPGQEDYFAKFIKPHIDDNKVRFIGSIGGKRKKQVFANAKVFLMPIVWNEPFGMVMIEALASGTPVIAFPYGAATEIVIDGYNGYSVADAAAMAEAISDIEAIESDDCYASVADRYAPQKIAQGYVSMYEKAING